MLTSFTVYSVLVVWRILVVVRNVIHPQLWYWCCLRDRPSWYGVGCPRNLSSRMDDCYVLILVSDFDDCHQ